MKLFMFFLSILFIVYILILLGLIVARIYRYRKFQKLLLDYINAYETIKNLLDIQAETPDNVKAMLPSINEKIMSNMTGVRKIMMFAGFMIFRIQEEEEFMPSEEYEIFIDAFIKIKQAALTNGEAILEEKVIQEIIEQV